jgi:hypothetical protein
MSYHCVTEYPKPCGLKQQFVISASVSQKFRSSLAEWLCLNVSHDIVIKMVAKVGVI